MQDYKVVEVTRRRIEFRMSVTDPSSPEWGTPWVEVVKMASQALKEATETYGLRQSDDLLRVYSTGEEIIVAFDADQVERSGTEWTREEGAR